MENLNELSKAGIPPRKIVIDEKKVMETTSTLGSSKDINPSSTKAVMEEKSELSSLTDPLVQHQSNEASALINRIKDEISKVVVGQEEVVNQVLCAFIASGHVLLEGVPGLGKTLIVKALAQTFNGDFARIQFTPDLMPADVMGHAFFNVKNQEFTIRRGPVFTNLLLADEINRAPAKTQSALLECMQEGQVTIEGESHTVDQPFMVLATQNPLEQEGTYPLPEAQLDRFLLKVNIEYPEVDEEYDLVEMVTNQVSGSRMDVASVAPVVLPDEIAKLQKMAAEVSIDKQVLEYAVNIVRSTRDWNGIAVGAGPRGAISLVRVARANALLNQRNFVLPEDVKEMALPTLRHRIALTAEMEIEGRTNDDLINSILEKVPAPRL